MELFHTERIPLIWRSNRLLEAACPELQITISMSGNFIVNYLILPNAAQVTQ